VRARKEKGTTLRLPVLIVSSDEANRQVIEEVSHSWMLESVACASLQEARSLLSRQGFGVIFCQDSLPDGTYGDLQSAVRHPSRNTRMVVLMSDVNKDQTYREAMTLGAFDVVPSPCSRKDIQWVIIRATRDRSMTTTRPGEEHASGRT
jgi:DNA-binding NtrC family response regulator